MHYLWKTGEGGGGGGGGVYGGQLSYVCRIVYDVLCVLFMRVPVWLTYTVSLCTRLTVVSVHLVRVQGEATSSPFIECTNKCK